MRRLRFVLLFPLTLMVIQACTSTTSRSNDGLEDMIVGVWRTAIGQDDLIGMQTVSFDRSGNFTETKEVLYSASDNGFSISIECNVEASGLWEIRKDTLMLNYSEKVSVAPVNKSFKVETIDSDAVVPLDIKEQMRNDVCSMLKESIPTQFMSIAGSYYPLGLVDDKI